MSLVGVAVCVVAAVGWLYLLRPVGVLALGPGIPGALPLQQLAGQDDQPLLRLAVVWVPSGAVAALLLRRPGGIRPAVALAIIAAVAAVLLVASGAVSDAVAVNEGVGTHVTPQFTRAGTLLALVFMLAGALPVLRRRPRG